MKSFLLQARNPQKLDLKISLKIQAPDSIYFLGICGTAMASLAVFIKQQGFTVTGSDKQIYPPMSDILKKNNIPVFNYKPSNIKSSLKLIVVGNVISKNHIEFKRLKKLKIPVLSFPEFLQQTVLNRKKNIVVAGSHGKSSTTALMSYVAQKLGKKPGFFMGALPVDQPVSFSASSSDWFVIEGDEYDSSFFAKKAKLFYYKPYAAILTGIEFDHVDIYQNLRQIIDVFVKWSEGISGVLVVSASCPQLKKIKKACPAPVITYGEGEGDWHIKNLKSVAHSKQFGKQSGQHFEICYQKKSYSCFLPLIGRHNALNALAVFALSYNLNWPAKEILEAFKTFKGIKRRLELKGKYQGAFIYEDFAHHPTEVKAGLLALKEHYRDKKLIAFFEPRSFTSRTNVFQKEYVEAFKLADLIVIAKEYDSSKIPERERFSSLKLVEDLKKTGKKAFYASHFKQIEEKFIKGLKPGEVAVFMSSGAFGGLLKKIEKNLI